jgi:chaperone modulatory protein CbpM
MITVDILVTRLSGLQRQDLERWIANEWVRADRHAGDYVFQEIDVARVRLIKELRDEMQVNEEALPVVLSLLDQLYEQRRRMRELCDLLRRTASDEVRQTLARYLANHMPSDSD